MVRNRFKARHRIVAAFLLAMAVLNGIEFWLQRARIEAGYGDFSALYTSGLLLREGKGRLVYDRNEQWKSQQGFAGRVDIRKGPMPFIRPPFEALVFLPLTYVSYPAALAIWSLIKIALLWLIARTLPRPHPFARIYPSWVEVVLCLGLFPVFLDLFQGQDAILLLLIAATTLNRLMAGKDASAGLVLALGLFKFHLVVPIVIMLWLAGRARVLIGFVPGAAALVAISCLISGAHVLYDYPAYLLSLNRASGAGVVTAQSMPNLRGILTAFLGRAPYPGPIHWLLLPVAATAIVVTACLWRRAMTTGIAGLALGFCVALLVAILTSYYAYIYDMTLLIIPLVLLGGEFLDLDGAGQAGLSTLARGMIAAGLLVLICTPLYWALILCFDCPYLLVVPMLVLAVGIAAAMRQGVVEEA
jgi:hypothetical protein